MAAATKVGTLIVEVVHAAVPNDESKAFWEKLKEASVKSACTELGHGGGRCSGAAARAYAVQAARSSRSPVSCCAAGQWL